MNNNELLKDTFKEITEKPFILFLPFLVIYILVIFLIKVDICFGDQTRYLTYARNMLQGFYSPPYPDINLGNGPGYPIFLIPFVAFKIPYIVIALTNAIMMYLSVVVLYIILRKYISFNLAIITTLFWAFYVNAYEKLPMILPEVFTLFLITLLIWSTLKSFESNNTKSNQKYLILAGFLFGYIALTKPIFGYVIITMLIGAVLLLLSNFNNRNYRRMLIILSFALLTTAPYLIYTYNLTGRVLYWSNFGGDNLYWMSTPFEGEYGNWYNFNNFENDSLLIESNIFGNEIHFHSNHKEVYKRICKYDPIEKDDALKEIAIQNIKNHPEKFILNVISNAGRIVFNFPYSFKLQTPRTLVRLPFNGFIVVFALLSVIPTLINWRRIPFSIRFLGFLTLIYLGGSLLASAETRMFTIVVPVLLLWISYMVNKTVKLNLKFYNQSDLT